MATRRIFVLVVLVVVPLAIAALLAARPSLDNRWQEPVAHLWLVGGGALAGAIVAALAGEAASRRGDARLFLLCLAFATSAVFLGVHALATPGAIADESSNGFEAAVPLGLALSALLAAASSVELDRAKADAVLRRRWLGWVGLVALAAAFTAAVLAGAGPLADVPTGTTTDRVQTAFGLAGTALFVFAAGRYLSLGQRRGRARLLASMVAALVLLADALVVVPLGRNWQLSWWEWHILMGMAFVVVAAVARREARREGGRAGLFDAVALERTLANVRADYSDALEDLVRAIERGAEHGEREDLRPMVEAVARRFDLTERQAELLEQAGRALGENRRLYRELDGLFRSYLSPDVAAALVAQPDLASLGGTVREISVLHADLERFTSFAEQREPAMVVDMLNSYFGAVVPAVLGEGGTITLFAGDAVMAVFGAPSVQPDHALRACRAGMALQRAAEEARNERSWPRFRVGVSTGLAVVGNVGSDALRTFTAIGDTVNLAARIEAAAPAGGVLISDATRAAAAALDGLRTEPVGELEVKGRHDRVLAHRVVDV
jgi:class 3 adenylate cyclase/peptidoglycan/LPS O-acetylase OafA/YrhL